MLFHSIAFVFAFLPLAVALFYAFAATLGPGAARLWLVVASLIFYGWWSPAYLLLLFASIAVNYAAGVALQAPGEPAPPRRRHVLVAGVAFNLLLLFYFKYHNFFVESVNAAFDLSFTTRTVVLPLAISFFTFQQITYLVDSYRGGVRRTTPLDYCLFVTFFPQLIAGPIVHHREMLPQFREPATYRLNADQLVAGLTLFLLGLAKKVVLADAFGGYANAGFDAAANGAELTLFAGWVAALSYTLQLYFDFSGYSDMAIGMARMVNVRLPLNFDSPYRATSIIEFWRRWHMTLSRFLRDYVYLPLGGNRKGRVRRYANLMATMLLGGLWHGAGWTFVLWGALHGLYLTVNHLWRGWRGAPAESRPWPARAAGWTLAFAAVVVAWVLFRAADVATAGRVYAAMLGLNGALLPEQVLDLLPFLRLLADGVGNVPHLGGGTVMGTFEQAVMLLLGMALVLLPPNLHRLAPRLRMALLVPCFALTLQRVVFADAVKPFLYFQF